MIEVTLKQEINNFTLCKPILCRVDDPEKEEEDKRYLLVVQIATRLVTFARRSAIDVRHSAVVRPIFKPVVSESVSHTGKNFEIHVQDCNKS